MKKSIIAFAVLYSIAPVLIKISEEWHDVGAAKLMAYQWGDWLILIESATAFAVVNLVAFFSTKWADYKNLLNGNGNGNGKHPEPPPVA